MRILKRGIHPQELEYQAKCRTCGTEFAFYINETQHYNCQKDGDLWQINCPHDPCSSVVSVYNLVPVNKES